MIISWFIDGTPLSTSELILKNKTFKTSDIFKTSFKTFKTNFLRETNIHDSKAYSELDTSWQFHLRCCT